MATQKLLNKTCSMCLVDLPVASFIKTKSKSGLSAKCKVCYLKHKKAWRAANRDKVKASNDKWTKANPELRKLKTQESAKKNKDSVRASHRRTYQKYRERRIQESIDRYEVNFDSIRVQRKLYRKANAAKINALNSKRNAAKLQATPSWLTVEDLQKIETLYEKAKWLESITGLEYEVDHIIPLQGKNVCGLHIWENLQLLESSLNRKKNNKY